MSRRRFQKKSFSGIELNNALKCCSEKNRAVVTKLFYGTLELALKYDYILSLYAKTVKPSVATALKMGLYAFEALNLPQAAAVNETVALIKIWAREARQDLQTPSCGALRTT